MYWYRDVGYYGSAHEFGENRNCPAYVPWGSFVYPISFTQYFELAVVGRYW